MPPGFSNTSRVGKRQIRTQQHIPAHEEFLELADPTNPNWTTALDRGKPIKEVGSKVNLCADGDEISGFIESVAVGIWDNGGQPCAVRKEGMVYALDEVGDMAIGDLAISGTQVPVAGTHPASSRTGQNPAGRVKKSATPATVINKWKVIEVYDSGADRVVLLLKI